MLSPALHFNQRLVAQSRRALVRPDSRPGHPQRQSRQRRPARSRHHALARRLESPPHALSRDQACRRHRTFTPRSHCYLRDVTVAQSFCVEGGAAPKFASGSPSLGCVKRAWSRARRHAGGQEAGALGEGAKLPSGRMGSRLTAQLEKSKMAPALCKRLHFASTERRPGCRRRSWWVGI